MVTEISMPRLRGTAAPRLPARAWRALSAGAWRALSAGAWAAAALAALVAAWWLVTALFAVPAVILPPPVDVWEAFASLPAYLLQQTAVTLGRTLLGFGVSVVAGLAIGGMIAASRAIERMCYPLLVGINAIPKVAVAPMLVAALGFGEKPVLVTVFLLCFFPIVLATATGLAATPVDFAQLAASLSATRWQLFRKVRVPAALPHVFVGLKVAMPLAAVGAVVGEFQSGVDRGLGWVILSTAGIGDTDTALAAVVLIALVSVPLFYAVALAERLLLPWVRETTSAR